MAFASSALYAVRDDSRAKPIDIVPELSAGKLAWPRFYFGT